LIKEFIQNSFIYSLGNILTRGIGIVLIPLYTRYLSPEEYGIIDTFMIFGSIISLTIALEIHQAVVRFYQDEEDAKHRMEYVSTAFIFTVFVYGLFFLLTYFFIDQLTLLFLDDIKLKNTFLIASLAITTNGLFYFTSGQLRWQILPKESVFVGVIHLIILACVAIYLLVIKSMNVDSIFIGQIVANLVGTFLSIYFTRKNYQPIFIYKKFQELVSFSYPLVFSGAAVFISLYIDRIAIKQLLGLEELGIYGLAYRFASITSIVMIAFQSSLSPLIYKHYKQPGTPQNIARLFDIFVIFALIIVCGSFLFSKELLFLMTVDEYYGAADLIPQLVIAIFFANMYIFVPGLALEKKTKTIAMLSLTNASLNTLFNFTMIPILGLMGASFATMLSSIITFGIYVHVSRKHYFINFSFFRKIVLCFFFVGCSILLRFYFGQTGINIIAIKMLFIIFVLLIMPFALLNKEDLKSLKSYIF